MWDYLIKTDWLVADVTSARSPDRAERDIFGVVFGVFLPVQALLWSGSDFVMQESPLGP